MINVKSVPEGGWDQIHFKALALVTYSESDSSFLRDGNQNSFVARIHNQNGKREYASSLALELREAMFTVSPEKGAWFYMRMVIKADGKFDVNFDYDTKPEFSITMDDTDFVKDYQRFPRDKAIMPTWLLDILSRNKIM